MLPEFDDDRSALDDPARREGEGQATRERRGQRRGSREALFGQPDAAAAPWGEQFSLPSLRAETGVLLERQLLISGTTEDQQGTRAWSGGRRRLWLRLGILLLVVAVTVPATALVLHYRNLSEADRARRVGLEERLDSATADRNRVLADFQLIEAQLRETKGELKSVVEEKRRLGLHAAEITAELGSVQEKLRSLQGEMEEVIGRQKRLEKQRLSDVARSVLDCLFQPFMRFEAQTLRAAVPVGPAATGANKDGS